MHLKRLQGLNLHMLPGDTLSLEELPPRALALDGIVKGPQQADQDRWSLDHHDNCLRLVTQATCEQVRTALCLGGAAWAAGRPIYVNDIDGDTILSVWLLSNPERANDSSVRTLVRAVGAMDAHGPASSFLLSEEENTVAAAYYRQAIKCVSDLRGKVREVFEEWPALLEKCFEGIEALLRGEISADVAPPVEVEVLHAAVVNGHKVAMATTSGWGFPALYARGFDAAILVQPAAGGTHTYTIAKRSDLVNVPVKDTLTNLASKEAGWGGGSSIGGSPRLEGGRSSSLTATEVWEAFVPTSAEQFLTDMEANENLQFHKG